MIAATRRWLRRNRTTFAVGFGILGVGYVATQYVLGKIKDAREQMSSDRIARENLRRRFEQNQEDCTFTVLALLPTATDNILAELETERITFELQQQKAAKLARGGDARLSELGSGPPSVTDDDGRSMISTHSDSGMHISQLGIPTASASAGLSSVPGSGVQDGGLQAQKLKKSKLQLWNDLKISAITRAFTLVYTLAFLTLLTRIQLNLLGRRSYLSSVVSLATGAPNDPRISLENHDDDTDQAYGNDFETNRTYLTFSWWLLHRGWKDMMYKVEASVKEVFGGLNIRDDVSMERFSELTLEVRKKVEGSTDAERKSSKWLQYLLPPREEEDFVLRESGMIAEDIRSSVLEGSTTGPTPLRRLLDETSDLIDSPPFTHVLTLLLDAGFSMLVDNKLAKEAYKVPIGSAGLEAVEPRITEIVDTKPVKLPMILATLTRQAHSIGNGMPNEYLQAMEQVKDLEAFAAVIYSSNWESEIGPVADSDSSTGGERDNVSQGSGAGEESLIDVGSASNFENAWGKATESVDMSTAT